MAGNLKKEQIISKVYYDVDEGLGSIQETYKKAKANDPSITLDEVKSFMIPVDLPWLESGGLEPRLKIKFSPNLVAFYQLLGLGVCGAGDVCKRWAPPIYWVRTMVME